MKHLFTTIAIALAACLRASVPLSWTATPRNPAPVAFDRHHGETLEFRCVFSGFGELPFGQAADIRLWYQTNGMAAAWWSVPASVSSNVLSATFPPQADPGADRLSLFFGAPSNAYASAVLRLRHSPGFTPNVLPAPESGYTEQDPVFAAWLADNPPREETDPTVPAWAKAETPPQTMTTNDVQAIVTNEVAGFTEWRLDSGWIDSTAPDIGVSLPFSELVISRQPRWEDLGETGQIWGGFDISVKATGQHYLYVYGGVDSGTEGPPDATNITYRSYEGGLWEITIVRDPLPTRNSLGLARLIDLPPLTNSIPDTAARAVYDVHDLMWDATESILYWHKIRQGHDEYIAVTNIDLTNPVNAAALKAWREANR
ncbi:MAG: hypothetical protein IKO72_00505 [Kiritimatiellae bacterium]|nr:hypothetical protein [Kiritimatiellia bacterium]